MDVLEAETKYWINAVWSIYSLIRIISYNRITSYTITCTNISFVERELLYHHLRNTIFTQSKNIPKSFLTIHTYIRLFKALNINFAKGTFTFLKKRKIWSNIFDQTFRESPRLVIRTQHSAFSLISRLVFIRGLTYLFRQSQTNLASFSCVVWSSTILIPLLFWDRNSSTPRSFNWFLTSARQSLAGWWMNRRRAKYTRARFGPGIELTRV